MKDNLSILVKQLREETGIGLHQAKETLELCDYDVDIAKEYTRLSGNAVKRYKMLDGEKIPFTKEDYVVLARKNVLARKDLKNEEMER